MALAGSSATLPGSNPLRSREPPKFSQSGIRAPVRTSQRYNMRVLHPRRATPFTQHCCQQSQWSALCTDRQVGYITGRLCPPTLQPELPPVRSFAFLMGVRYHSCRLAGTGRLGRAHWIVRRSTETATRNPSGYTWLCQLRLGSAFRFTSTDPVCLCDAGAALSTPALAVFGASSFEEWLPVLALSRVDHDDYGAADISGVLALRAAHDDVVSNALSAAPLHAWHA